jgi:TolB-like protein/DNA-binding SARP family transcriptional activator/Tfp pilus assembly protein PilF
MQNGLPKGRLMPAQRPPTRKKDSLPGPKFSLSLLGHVQLEGRDGLVDLPNKKLAGLLAYLASTAPQPQPRERLSALLWGSHFDAQAKQNLRQALFRLRKVLGQDALKSDGEVVSLDPQTVSCDVARFEALIREGSRDALSQAADLYRGRFVDDVAVSEEAWNDWLGAERERLQDLALGALVDLAQQELAAGRGEHALKAAQRAVALNSMREDAHRLIVQALAATGRKAEALKHYEDLTALLERELSTEPDAATKALIAELRSAKAPPTRPAAPPPAAAAAPSPPAAAQAALPLPDRPSIAVLAFANLSSDPEQEYFADGIVEDILTLLSRESWLFVIARNSSFAYRNRAVDVKQIGRELGVRYAVEGSVRKAANRVRVTAQLIEAETGAHVWADRYERDLSDIFALQDEITQKVVHAIAPSLRALEIRRALAKPTESLQAYDYFLRALPAIHEQTEDSAKRAEALLRKAVEVDPSYPDALGMLADIIATRTVNGWHENLMLGLQESLEMARRALAAGPENSTCLACAALTYVLVGRRFEEGLQLAERALALHPNSVFVRIRAGVAYVNCGESEKALEHFESGWRMNPQDPKALTFTGMCAAHFFARRFEECVAWGRRAVGETAGANIARRHVAAALAHLGRIKEAKAEIAQVLKHQPTSSLARSRLSSFRHEWMYDLYLEGLRKAGLPET